MMKRKVNKELSVKEVFKKNVGNVTLKNVTSKGMLLLSCFLVLIITFIYLFTTFSINSGSFTIKVTELSIGKLALSETIGFSNPTTCLSANANNSMTNITFENINIEKYRNNSGSINEKNTLAYTFFVKNEGNKEFSYTAHLDIIKATRNTDAAIRVILLKNNEMSIYAKAKTNGEREEYPSQVINFANDNQIFVNQNNQLNASEIDRYTIIIYLEGEDEDCVNSVIGGWMQLQLIFEINQDVTNRN